MKTTRTFDLADVKPGTTKLEAWKYSEILYVITTTATSTFKIQVSEDDSTYADAPITDIISGRAGTGAETFKLAYIGNAKYVKFVDGGVSSNTTTAVALGLGKTHS